MHQVVEAERKIPHDQRFQRDDPCRGEQLLEGRVEKFPVQHRQHLFPGGGDVAHHAAVVEQAVIGAVAGVELHFHRHHEVHRGDQDAQKGQQCRDVVIRCPVEQPLHLHTDGAQPDQHEVGKQPDVDAQARQGQRQKAVHPTQKEPGAALPVRKIAAEPPDVQHQHDAVSQRHCKEKAFQRRSARQQHQQRPGPEGRAHRRRKGDEDAAVVLEGGQEAHGVPVHDHLRKEGQAKQPLQKRRTGHQQKQPIQPTSARQQQSVRAPE